MKYICPLITVKDIRKAQNFYEDVLNQKVKYNFGENITFEGDFALHQSSHFQKLIDNRPIKEMCNNFELYFELDDVDKLENRLDNINIEFVHKTREQPWKQKVVRFYDPDGNMIEVGETMEHLANRLYKDGKSIHEINEITSLPKEFIKSSIVKFR